MELPEELLKWFYAVDGEEIKLSEVPKEWRDKVAILLHR